MWLQVPGRRSHIWCAEIPYRRHKRGEGARIVRPRFVHRAQKRWSVAARPDVAE